MDSEQGAQEGGMRGGQARLQGARLIFLRVQNWDFCLKTIFLTMQNIEILLWRGVVLFGEGVDRESQMLDFFNGIE